MSRYVPTGATAAGGIGAVEFCTDQNLDRKVAVKFVHSSSDNARLLDELAALQLIRSKHVVEVFDVAHFPPGKRMGIVEEFIDGADLTGMLGTLKPDGAFVRLLYQMCAGLADMHAVGVVHRDIKPNNMLVDGEGILKIIDFNLARPTDEARTEGFRGTRGYAAPELYATGEVEFDEKIDVYAAGIVAYALLTGALPKELQAQPPRPSLWKAATGGFSKLYPDLDAELAKLLDAALGEDPTARPRAAEIRDRAASMLLHGKHRALFTMESGQTFELHSGRRLVTLSHPGPLGSVSVAYDSHDFYVKAVSGEVWVNNIEVSANDILPECCVIALGSPQRSASERMFVTMDVSHPEVVL